MLSQVSQSRPTTHNVVKRAQCVQALVCHVRASAPTLQSSDRQSSAATSGGCGSGFNMNIDDGRAPRCDPGLRDGAISIFY